MRVATALRTNPAAWLALPLVVFCIFYAQIYSPATSEPYALAATAAASVTIVFVAPVAAAAGAWEAGRWRRARWWDAPSVRSPLALFAASVWPAAAMATLALVAAAASRTIPIGEIPDIRPIALGIVVATAHATAGFAVGLRLPTVVAAPGSLVASYVWMAYPRAMQPLWLRHLTGDVSSCCQLHQDLAPQVVVVAVLTALAIAAAAAIFVMARRFRLIFSGLAALPLIGVALLGSIALGSIGPDPVTARADDALSCSRGSIEVCVWREHAQLLEDVAATTRASFAAWAADGLATPTRVTEGAVAPSERAYQFFVPTPATPNDVIQNLSYAVTRAWPACSDTGSYPGIDALPYVQAWLSTDAGMPRSEVEARFVGYPADPSAPTVPQVVAALKTTSRQARARWLSQNLEAISRCGVAPQFAPG